MATEDADSIAAQIDDDPSLVGVTAAEDRADDEGEVAAVDETDQRVTWASLWAFYADDVAYEFPHVLSKTQLATAVCGHPHTGFRDVDAAKQRIEMATEDGELVNTGQYGTRYAVWEDVDGYV